MTGRASSGPEAADLGGRLEALTRLVIRWWALAGGALLVGIVLLTAYSAAMNILLSAPVAGDFEIVEVGVAIAAFTFLPYCQLTRANVTVDFFTAWAGPRTEALLGALASVVALLFAALLLWRMSEGMIDYRRYQEYTAITGFPLWMAFPPILVSLFLLVLASLITTRESMAALRSGRRIVSATGDAS